MNNNAPVNSMTNRFLCLTMEEIYEILAEEKCGITSILLELPISYCFEWFDSVIYLPPN